MSWITLCSALLLQAGSVAATPVAPDYPPDYNWDVSRASNAGGWDSNTGTHSRTLSGAEVAVVSSMGISQAFEFADTNDRATSDSFQGFTGNPSDGALAGNVGGDPSGYNDIRGQIERLRMYQNATLTAAKVARKYSDVPEPMTSVMLGVGLFGLARIGRPRTSTAEQLGPRAGLFAPDQPQVAQVDQRIR